MKSNLLGLLGMLLLLACTGSQHSTKAKFEEIEKAIYSRMIGADQLIAVAFKNLDTGETFFVNEKISMHAASLMKVLVMIEAYKQAAAGKFSMSDSVQVINQFKSIVDGSPFSIDLTSDSQDPVCQKVGQKMTYRELIYHMITISSNLATNILIERIDVQNVTNTMRASRADDIQVLRGVEDLKAFSKGLNNTTTAFDMMLIMEAIAQKRVATPETCEDMLAILRDQKYRTKIPALLPKGVNVAHKTGSITKIDHDAVIIEHPNGVRYILVVMTRGLEHEQAVKHISEISKRIYEVISPT